MAEIKEIRLTKEESEIVWKALIDEILKDDKSDYGQKCKALFDNISKQLRDKNAEIRKNVE